MRKHEKPNVPQRRNPRRKATLTACAALLLTVLGGWALPAQAQAAPGSTYYQIVNRDNRCLAVSGAATHHAAPVGVQTCSGASNELWDIQPIGDGYYFIKVRHTGMCLNVAYFGQADGSDIVQATCSGTTNEQWLPRDSGDGEFWLVARHSQKCLDKTGDDTTQWACHKKWAWWQQWRWSDTGIPVG
ncbi:RICIN domain-containing protein [Amycolatopsis alba]|uniref:Ricin B lectin domain-containing protein n=1 Tax=Amycolatopsis alba DSM 44262 TaxID=1125972 RepID=A0A229RD45_AMYAL|nr:RICIN domain-containing protein [Amycolatopsis alba]OXM44567.1 hypothetical protein CFP75_34035 [Amycolatopsis alba DSM 44262]